MKINDKLNNINTYPFHMPGHKRNEKFNISGSNIDITEIYGFDNLHNSSGIIKEVEDGLAQIYSAKRSFMLVNGSTVGILSAIFAVCNEDDLIIVARNCHKSVYNACMLKKLRIVYIEPEYDEINGFYMGISQAVVDNAIKNHPDAKCVVITSPSYEGYISEISCSIPLIIDAAHGAHLGLGSFPKYPRADIVISSLHKTLPALTQAAVANIYNSKFIDRFKLYVDIFETSSPSYTIMDSVAKCVDYINYHSEDFDRLIMLADDIHNLRLNRLRVLDNDDVSKIVVSTAYTDISGVELSNMLREEYCIEVEMASEKYAILMSTVGDDESAFNRLKEALAAIDSELMECTANYIVKPCIPADICEISIADGYKCDIRKSVGMVSNEFIYAYPPDIPILCPNEIITNDVVKYIENAINIGVSVVSDSGLLPNNILTKKQL